MIRMGGIMIVEEDHDEEQILSGKAHQGGRITGRRCRKHAQNRPDHSYDGAVHKPAIDVGVEHSR